MTPSAGRALLAIFLIAVLAPAGCGQGNGCPARETGCSPEGAVRCGEDGSRLEACMIGPGECLVWTQIRECGLGERCDDSGGAPGCVVSCEAECGVQGQMRCSGTIVQQCLEGGDGCLVWESGVDCAADGRECGEQGGLASCVGECTGGCGAAGATRCDGDVVQTCRESARGCLRWEDSEDCAPGGMVCVESGGTAGCDRSCPGACEAQGVTRCSGAWVQTCVPGSDACLGWEGSTDCSAAGKSCNDASGEAECICPAACTEGDTTCAGTAIETCALQTNGCLDFAESVDCAGTGLTCGEVAGEAACVCVSLCSEGETRCSGTLLQTCEWQPGSCWAWGIGHDCRDDGLVCRDLPPPAACAPGTGESCEDYLMVTELPYTLEGSDFMGDFADDMDLWDPSCRGTSSSPEAVFAVELKEGETLVVRERGNLNADINLMWSCTTWDECAFSVEDDYGGAFYTAPWAGRIYIVIEAAWPTSSEKEYVIFIGIAYPELCGDGVDNDLDFRVDCDDADCFGNPVYCASEVNCHDRADNDADTLPDCDDSDCASSPWCGPYHGFWERFEPGDEADVGGHGILYVPDPSGPERYAWSVLEGVTGYAVTPGSGLRTLTLTMSDEFEEYGVSLMPPFPFYDVPYGVITIQKNGCILLGARERGYYDDPSWFFSLPRAVAFNLDANLWAGGSIIVDEFADRVAVTWDAVPEFGAPGVTSSFQAVLGASGSIEVVYPDIQTIDAGMIGISNGVGRIIPAETDFVTP